MITLREGKTNNPATQTFPGARRTELTIIDVTYLLIMCRISCTPTELFTGSTFSRTIAPLHSVPLEKKYSFHTLMLNCNVVFHVIFGAVNRFPVHCTGGNTKFKWHFSNIKQALNLTKYLSRV